jgi:hypothetical protein
VAAVFLLMMLLAVWRRRAAAGGAPADRMIGWLSIDFVFLLPLALLTLGKFPIYYTWMAYIPAVLIGAVWAQRARERGIVWPLPIFLVFALAAAVAGNHDRIATRDMALGSPVYAQFQRWVRNGLSSPDLVFADHEAYFAARTVAERVIAPTYAQTVVLPGIPEHDKVSALLVQRANAEKAQALMGGAWKETASFRATAGAAVPDKLDYVMLRRAGAR